MKITVKLNGEKLKSARLARGLKQHEVEEANSLLKGQLTQYENNRAAPELNSAIRLAWYFQTPLRLLVEDPELQRLFMLSNNLDELLDGILVKPIEAGVINADLRRAN